MNTAVGEEATVDIWANNMVLTALNRRVFHTLG